MKTSKFKIGDIVVPNYLGRDFEGQVIGVVCTDVYKTTQKHICHDTWSTNKYANWIYKYVYYVQTNKPKRQMFFAEFLTNPKISKQIKTFNLNRKQQKRLYKSTIPKYTIMTYPEQDLAIV